MTSLWFFPYIIAVVALIQISFSGNVQFNSYTDFDFQRKSAHDDSYKIGETAAIVLNPKEADIIKGENLTLTLSFRGQFEGCTILELTSSPEQITSLPEPYEICGENIEDGDWAEISLETSQNGIVTLQVTTNATEQIDTSDAFCSVSVGLNNGINIASAIFGWIYTIAWDISFLPQIIHNWKRKSVIGLSFDFITLNFIGFTAYFFYNAGLLWIPGIQDQYYDKNPTSILHVKLNDVIFPAYALLCTAVQIVQCFRYERGEQRVSTTCRIISAALISLAAVYAILVPFLDNLLWLNFLYFLSYEKLTISCIKYTPQLYLNYKQKNTLGWSIWQVILDFTGGSLSLLQMFLLAVNYDDWHSVLTDPAKLGLGLLSVGFNILFFIQHFILYRDSNHGRTEPEKILEDK